MMNKTSIIVESILAIAVVVLFVLHFTQPKAQQVVTADGEMVASQENLPVAYLNLDSLLANYAFAQEAQEKLMSKQEDARLKMNTKMRTFQSEYEDFQRKLNNNAFLSRERAESEANRLQKKQDELQELEAKLTNEIMIENQNLNMQLRDSLDNYLKIFNADGKYQIIFANTASDNVLLAQPGYDITNEVVDGLNARYKK